MARVPADLAFEFYVLLGPDRSYRAVADEFGVSKQAISKLARRDRWSVRVADHEQRSRERSMKRIEETLDAVRERHLKTLQVMQRKALEVLQAMPLTTAMEAVRTLDIAITKERLVRGEPSDRMAVDIESVLRDEYQRWMVPTGADGGLGDDE